MKTAQAKTHTAQIKNNKLAGWIKVLLVSSEATGERKDKSPFAKECFIKCESYEVFTHTSASSTNAHTFTGENMQGI